MTLAARNDSGAQRLITFLFAEGVSPANITRLLNYHFTDTFSCHEDTPNKHTIRRVPEGSNYAPPVVIWKQP